MTAHIVQGNALDLPLPDESVDLIVTSPPYNCGIDYGDVSDDLTEVAYDELAAGAATEMDRVLVRGGRVFVNVSAALPTEGSDERKSPALVWQLALARAGLRYRDTLVWHQSGQDQPTAWGSFCSPNAPNIRGRWEAILLFFKGSWRRGRVERNDISPDKFAPWTSNVWHMPTGRANGHPAVFPAEIPRRAILLSTWPGDVVLDPFVGSGTTVKVAKDLGRVGIGVDLSSQYVEMSRTRCAQQSLDLFDVAGAAQ